jgi:hypothetical protein
MVYQDEGIAGEGDRGLKSLEGCASDSLTASSKRKIKFGRHRNCTDRPISCLNGQSWVEVLKLRKKVKYIRLS